MVRIVLGPVHVCRAFFLLATVATLSANALPVLHPLLVSYGPRSTATSPKGGPQQHLTGKRSPPLDFINKLQVPHSWFIHYYIASVASSLFWAYQIANRGHAFKVLATLSRGETHASMTMNQAIITWLFMAVQGSRRLYECVTLLKPSTAKMPVTTWVVGIAFYLIMGLSVWIEALRKSYSDRLH